MLGGWYGRDRPEVTCHGPLGEVQIPTHFFDDVDGDRPALQRKSAEQRVVANHAGRPWNAS
jgi:hypothetical protein